MASATPFDIIQLNKSTRTKYRKYGYDILDVSLQCFDSLLGDEKGIQPEKFLFQ